ncbi:ABC transporter substrate-binding protein [Agrobacterium tumefaciens]|uniref:glycine betaine ABC transporter substrate-binding protein n=1 Tax=Agrobacterium tumefaciens TaxID=358 RepID=UPI001572DC24|nr:glycine betaine ABC transporter substrate-binding protein [Agrobacterium tumefaciens]NTE68173.1 ABC transporter substrate-binding protein [Agrobacterium tumefaciens]
MKTVNWKISAVAGALSCIGFTGPIAAYASECGDVTIASMNWQSADLLASVDKIILAKGYGCNASTLVGDTVPTFTSMISKQQPDIAPEGWVDLQPDLIKRGIDEKKLVIAGKAFADGGVSGWWVPKYFADAHPDIKSITDAFKHPELFPAPEDEKKGAVFNGPQGWGDTIVTAQLFKAFRGKESGFTLVDTGSSAGLDGSIVRAYERKLPWLGFYWSPTAIMGKYEMVRLEHGVPHDPAEWKRCNTVSECPDPKPNDWAINNVQTLVTGSFAERGGPAYEYLQKRVWPNGTINKVLAWMNENQATGADGAEHFLKENKDIWTKWVSPEAAEKIEASL